MTNKLQALKLHPISNAKQQKEKSFSLLSYRVAKSRTRPKGLSARTRICLWLLLLSHVSRVRLCATPQTAAH